ncbi:MAG: septum formation initiator family protein, partial [Pseudomonadota bacterium]|nr:septum formation initiator family protein [Pseudomonadota bacterium]
GHIHFLENRLQKEKENNGEKRLRNAALRAEIADLKDNTQVVEAIARSDLGMIQDGEILFILPEN